MHLMLQDVPLLSEHSINVVHPTCRAKLVAAIHLQHVCRALSLCEADLADCVIFTWSAWRKQRPA